MLFDSSNGNVRAAVIDGVLFMLDNPLTHSVLKPILPSLGGFIHDSIENVRLSMCKLLNRIKNLKFIRYYDIISIENIHIFLF